MTEGPIIWIYIAETLGDVQFGLAGGGLTANLLLLAFLTEYI